MKLFLDRNRTLLPRIDVMYLLTRVMTLMGALWFAFVVDHPFFDDRLLYVLLGTYVAHLVVFFLAINGKFDLKLAYLSAIIYDIMFVPLSVSYTGTVNSPFFLVFFLTVSVAAYVLTFRFAMVTMIVISTLYLMLLYGELDVDSLPVMSMRLGFLWVWFLVITYASEYLRRSEGRLLKLFDTLNMRTSELEKSQAELEMVYENTRNLAAMLEPDGVVKEIVRIMSRTLQYEHFAIVFIEKNGGYYFRARLIDGQKNLHLKAINVEKNELIRKVGELDEAIRLKDVTSRKDYVPLKEGAQSVLIVPMTAHGNTLGLLVAESCAVDTFSDKDVQMLTVVSRSASLALENAELHKRTEELSIIDDLTGAFNYRYFIQKLQEERKRATRYQLPVSIIMADIDWFKKLNDSYGHEVGNVVLKNLAKVIGQCIRDVDIFARYGGEEFVVILPQTARDEASVIGERIRQRVADMIIDAGVAGKLKITVSIGVSSFPENGKSAEEIVSVADQALYRAKDSGKNLVCIA